MNICVHILCRYMHLFLCFPGDSDTNMGGRAWPIGASSRAMPSSSWRGLGGLRCLP